MREAVKELMTASGDGERDSESLQDEGNNDIESANESEALTQDSGTFSEMPSAQDIADSQPANDIPAQDDVQAPQVLDLMQESYAPNDESASQASDLVQDSYTQDYVQAPQASDLTRDSYTQDAEPTLQTSYPAQDFYTADDVQTLQVSDLTQDSYVQDDEPTLQTSYPAQDFHTANDIQAPQVLDLTQDAYTQDYVQAPQASDLTQDAYAQDAQPTPQTSYPAQDFHTADDVQASQVSDLTQDSYVQDDTQATNDTHESPADNDSPQDDPANQTHEWQEQATGFTLSLDEPPPELWTHINDDDEDVDYEPTDSLQGAAYVQIHGRNFTERLQHTLKHRKERAHERAEAERELNPNRAYMQKTIIICATMLMVLGFAWLSLWFIRRETPEGMNIRAESLANNGEYEQAASIYQTAYRRYPHMPEFLAGLAENAGKSGHVQTAKTAWDEYIRVIPRENSRDITHAKEQLELLGGDIAHEQSQHDPSENLPPVKKPETTTQIKPAPQKQPEPQKSPEHFPLKEIPLSFEFYLSEGNYAYNIGMFNRATVNFFKAMEIDSNDIRPYIGLASCYYAKGMYFDSKRILDEARKKFKRDPTIEMGYKILREAK